MASSYTSRPLPSGGPTAGGHEFDDDELDDLLAYDPDAPLTNFKPAESQENSNGVAKGKSGAGLGIDEEVEVTRKPRAPRVKLDEDRLLSRNGIPKLRNKAKNHLKFKGKGHEYSDASKLLSFYQLWLDDLFPKARFLDALSMVEKMGHKKRMQMARMDWINEGKPHSSVHEDSLFDESAPPQRDNEREKTAPRVAPIFETSTIAKLKTPEPTTEDAEMEDDIYDATPRPVRQKPSQDVDSQDSLFGGGASIFGPAKEANVDDEFPDDDLDALLAEEEALKSASGNIQPVATAEKAALPEPDFDDEMEAMAEMDDMW